MKIKLVCDGEVTQEFEEYEELIKYLNDVDGFTQIVVEE